MAVIDAVEPVTAAAPASRPTRGELVKSPLSPDSVLLVGEDVQEIPGLAVLGFGYDIFDLYADPRSVTLPLLNLPADTSLINVGNRTYKVPSGVRVLPLSRGETSLLFGTTITEFQEEFAVQAGLSGSFGFFKASIEAEYSRNVAENTEWQFVSIRDSAQAWLLQLPADEELLPYLDPTFKQDLNSSAVTPRDLFDKYGTHFVANAIIGGKLIFNCHVSRQLESQQTNIEVQVKAGYTALTGSVNFQSGVSLDQSFESFTSTYNARLTVLGGDSAKALELADPSLKGGFATWAATVADNPVLVDFDKRSLRPVWVLAESADRRRELEDFFNNVFLPEHKPLAPKPGVVELEGRYTAKMTSVYTDQGSGADWNGELYRPDLTEDEVNAGYVLLGYYAQGGVDYRYGSAPFNSVLIVRETGQGTGSPALVKPLTYTQIWDDTDSGAEQDASIWRPSPPEGYVALGFVVKPGEEHTVPPSVDEVRCVRKDLVDPAGFGSQIWSDAGSGAEKDVSVYEIKPNQAYGLRAGTFHAQPNHDNASGEAWAVRATAVNLLQS